jgi:hypothetical protein
MRLFQGYFDEASKQYLDPLAVPVDISFNLNHPLYEFNIFRSLLDKKIMDPAAGPVGLISWKFETKTLVSVGEFCAFCDKAFAAGADVAFINPMIAAEAVYKDVWEQAEHAGHKGMRTVVDALFSQQQRNQLGLMPKSAFAFCNYFVGNARFWSDYMAFCDEILNRIEAFKETNPPVYELVYGSANYFRNSGADFRPFILERLFSSFLLLQPGIRSAHFEYAPHVYDKKFGADIGKYLHLLSGLKNNGFNSRNLEVLKKWNEARIRLLLGPPMGIELMDDPPAGPVDKKQQAEAGST